MIETVGSPPPQVEGAPKKISPWIVAVLVIVLVCCTCFGVAGLLIGFWDPIRQAFRLSTLLSLLTALI